MGSLSEVVGDGTGGGGGSGDAVLLTGNQTIAGIKTFTSTISGSINGNAATATNATNATNATTATNAGNATTVTNGVYTTGDQTIGGTKTFSTTIVGSINGNAATATSAADPNAVKITGNQTVAGIKTFNDNLGTGGYFSQGFVGTVPALACQKLSITMGGLGQGSVSHGLTKARIKYVIGKVVGATLDKSFPNGDTATIQRFEWNATTLYVQSSQLAENDVVQCYVYYEAS